MARGDFLYWRTLRSDFTKTRREYGYRMGVKPYLIEVLTKIDGLSFDEAAEGSRTFRLDNRDIAYIARQALIKNKRAAGRAKDLADLEWLETHPDPTEEPEV
jgi:hypothetical protein